MELFVGDKVKYKLGKSTFDAEIIKIQDNYVILFVCNKRLRYEKENFLNTYFKAELEKEMREKARERKRKEREEIEQAYKSIEFVKKNETEEPRQCKNCMELKKGNCVGAMQICEFFRYSPKISNKERDRWPVKNRASKNKGYIREYDWMYNKYNETYH